MEREAAHAQAGRKKAARGACAEGKWSVSGLVIQSFLFPSPGSVRGQAGVIWLEGAWDSSGR